MRFCFSIVKTNASFTLWFKRTLLYPKFTQNELKFCPKVSIKESFYTCVEHKSKFTSNLTTICDTFFSKQIQTHFPFQLWKSQDFFHISFNFPPRTSLSWDKWVVEYSPFDFEITESTNFFNYRGTVGRKFDQNST